jgi:synaptojanin
MAGNKGAIAIRLEYGTTAICFVTAHLAAGHSNVEQRNMDYHTIDKGLHFTRGRKISDHDLIFWASDSNYRIDISNEEVRKLVAEEAWDKLYEHDQLNLGMLAGETFRFFNEGPILFPPTYKFDNGTDTYDTSEKQRIPAWTDRILYRGQGIKLLEYASANLKMSDHRPVYASFAVQCRIVDETKRQQLAREIYEKRKHMVGDVLKGNVQLFVESNGKRCPFLTTLMKVPPPSSDRKKWWLNHNASSKAEIPKPPGEGWILNPKRPKNPWDPTDEPDWIKATTMQAPNSTERKPRSTETKVPPVPPPRRRQTEQTPPSPEIAPELPRRPTSASVSDKPKPAIPPKPEFIKAASRTSSMTPSEDGDFKPAPPLPPKTRKEADKNIEKDEKVGLLMDRDDDEKFVGSWKPLQPSKEL